MNRLLFIHRLASSRASRCYKTLNTSGTNRYATFTTIKGDVRLMQNMRCSNASPRKPVISDGSSSTLLLPTPRWKLVQMRHLHDHDRDRQNPNVTRPSDESSPKKEEEDYSGGASGSSDRTTPRENSAFTASSQWRTRQLQKLTTKFQPDPIDPQRTGDDDHDGNEDDGAGTTTVAEREKNHSAAAATGTSTNEDPSAVSPIINEYDDVQQMWRDMESRVTKRRSVTLAQAKEMGRNVGRQNTRKTDEEVWLSAGVYDGASDDGADCKESDGNSDNDDDEKIKK